jgi:hypothetical protein
MSFGYMIYQAERPMSRAEQRAADIRRGELAAALSRLLRRGRKARPADTVTTLTPETALPAVPDCACALCFEQGPLPRGAGCVPANS